MGDWYTGSGMKPRWKYDSEENKKTTKMSNESKQSSPIGVEQAAETQFFLTNADPFYNGRLSKPDYMAGFKDGSQWASPRWIKASERLPDIDTTVIVRTEYMSSDKEMVDFFTGYMDEYGELIMMPHDESYGWDFKDCVTHWMPMPPFSNQPKAAAPKADDERTADDWYKLAFEFPKMYNWQRYGFGNIIQELIEQMMKYYSDVNQFKPKADVKSKEWVVEYDNETGANDESFSEWWSVTNGDQSFKSYDELDAKFLCNLLNAKPQEKTFTLQDMLDYGKWMRDQLFKYEDGVPEVDYLKEKHGIDLNMIQ